MGRRHREREAQWAGALVAVGGLEVPPEVDRWTGKTGHSASGGDEHSRR